MFSVLFTRDSTFCSEIKKGRLFYSVDKEGEDVKETGRRRLFLMKENLGD